MSHGGWPKTRRDRNRPGPQPASVTTANLDEVKQEWSYLLGFNEPDMASQSNMSVQQALDLWPQLEPSGPVPSGLRVAPRSWRPSHAAA